MLISEFIDRTGFRPTHECYEKHIEPMYIQSNLDKDEWCKQWKRKGGIAEAYQWQVIFDTAKINEEKETSRVSGEKVADLERKIKELEEHNGDLIDECNDLHVAKEMVEDFENEKAAMTVFLIEQAEKWAATDLREKAIELMGAREYLAYKINHNMNLWQADKDIIIELLNK